MADRATIGDLNADDPWANLRKPKPEREDGYTGNYAFARAIDQNIKKGEARRLVFLQELAKHKGAVGETLTATSTPRATYEDWRRKYPDFKARCNSTVAQYLSRNPLGPDRKIEAQSFDEFRLRYFNRKTQPHQARLVDILDNVQEREIVLVLLWPEAGKTATLEDWTCQRIAYDPNIRISYLTESQDLSKKVLGFVKSRMMEPEYLDYQTDFGPFYEDGQERAGKPWTTSYITVAKSTHAERDYTMQCRAVTSRAYGSRIDLLIGDDVQSRETYTQTDKIFSHLRQTYFTRGKKMTMVFIGTRIGPGDVYEKLIENDLIDHLILIPAANGTEPTVPESWADPEDYETHEEFLEAARSNMARIRRHVGEEVWWASYQQAPIHNALASFTAPMIEKAKDHNRICGPARPGSLVYLSLDPALGGMNALFALDFTKERLTILDLQTDTGFSQTEQIMHGIRDFALRYKPSSVIIEKNAFQKGLANDFRLNNMGQELGFRIVTHETGNEKNDPILGVAAMAGSFNAGLVRIPWGDDATRHRLNPLVTQLEAWRPNIPTRLIQQDTVMALWFGWKHWRAWQDTLRYSEPKYLSRPSWLGGNRLAGSRR